MSSPYSNRDPDRTRPSTRDDRWPVVAVGIALIAVLSLSFGQELGHRTGMEMPAPAVTFPTPEDDTIHLSDLEGDVVLVGFWAGSCSTCISQMPLLQRVWERHRDGGFHVIGLSLDDGGAAGLAEAGRALGVAYPLAVATPRAQRVLGYGGTLPTTVLLDREGRVVEHFLGAVDAAALEMAVIRAVGTEK